jgi:ABC-type multidrug transport system fused ATPase/permease subunit
MNALFRIQELAGGKMFIGGVDTATIPLHTLRSRIGMVPQDPGTLDCLIIDRLIPRLCI